MYVVIREFKCTMLKKYDIKDQIELLVWPITWLPFKSQQVLHQHGHTNGLEMQNVINHG